MRVWYAGLIIFSVISLISCSSDDGGGSKSEFKSIFDEWTREDDQFAFDLTGADFDSTFDMYFLLSSGEICLCDCVVTGSESSGAAAVSNCIYVSGGGGDPGCPGLWENGGTPYTYTKSGADLTLCNNSTLCADYR